MRNYLLIIISLFLLILGQPHVCPLLCIAPIFFAYGLFFFAVCDMHAKRRFWTATVFFTLYQITSLWWLTSHPFNYIHAVLLSLSFLFGLQFGVAALFASRDKFRGTGFLLIPAFITLFEWTRLFLFSGYALHPVGLPATLFTSTQYLASYVGILGLTFFALLVNCLFTRALICKRASLYCVTVILWIGLSVIHIQVLREKMNAFDKVNKPLDILVIHAKALPEELEDIPVNEQIKNVGKTWKSVVQLIAQYPPQTFDFVIFPELFFPFPAASPLFSIEDLNAIMSPFETLPPFTSVSYENSLYVSSLEISKILAQSISTPLIIGLEGVDYAQDQRSHRYYNSVFFIKPEKQSLRYDKIVLLPMGEYIPFTSLAAQAAKYGITGSFSVGKELKTFVNENDRITPTICYEDTFSWIGNEASKLHATLLVNLTNDGWFPSSKLGEVHFAHSRVRCIETGLPLVRACNFGVSGAFDALGNVIEKRPFNEIQSDDAFAVKLSRFHYKTLYDLFGDTPILLLSLAIIAIYILKMRNRSNIRR